MSDVKQGLPAIHGLSHDIARRFVRCLLRDSGYFARHGNNGATKVYWGSYASSPKHYSSSLLRRVGPEKCTSYTCPLLLAQVAPTLIILFTGESCTGKDYCADFWVSVFITYIHINLTARAISISDATKREYAAATGADLNRLCGIVSTKNSTGLR